MYINSNSIIDETLSLLIANNFPPTPLLNSCFSHLTTILNNLIAYPNEEKYRVIKKTNERIAKELLIFPEAEQFLLILGFEEMNLEGNLCLFYAYGNDEQDKLENALKILKNKHKNEVIFYLNSDSQGGNPEVRQEVNKRKKELEEIKETKENLIKEFEANKKYNIELKQKKNDTNANDDIKISNKIEYKEIKPGVKCPIVDQIIIIINLMRKKKFQELFQWEINQDIKIIIKITPQIQQKKIIKSLMPIKTA